MSKYIKTLLTAFAVLAIAQVAAAGSVTVGTGNTANCFPFMCNESGTSSGPSIDYQQVFASTAFSGPVSINSLTWYYFTEFGGSSTALGGTYKFEWGYAPLNAVNNLSTTLGSNYISGPNVLGTLLIPAGGINDNPSFTFSSFTPFNYNPANGDLLLEVLVSNQDNVLNGTGNGYNTADGTGTVTSRAYCVEGSACSADGLGLVTTFGTTTSATPEPSSILLFGTSLLGLAPFRRKLFGR